MPVIVVTRLRVRDASLTDAFFAGAVSVLEQANASDGILGTDVLADANNAWWTVSVWSERAPMRAFVGVEPHRTVMGQMDNWCDEATFVDWEQDDATVPDWETCHNLLVADGTVAPLTHASPAHATRAFPMPVNAGA